MRESLDLLQGKYEIIDRFGKVWLSIAGPTTTQIKLFLVAYDNPNTSP